MDIRSCTIIELIHSLEQRMLIKDQFKLLLIFRFDHQEEPHDRFELELDKENSTSFRLMISEIYLSTLAFAA
jgi:hypothetical protein